MCFLLLFLQGCAFGDIDGLYHEEAKTEITDSEETRAPEAKVENIVSANEMMTVEQEPEDERAMFENCYYYEQLSESQKEIYQQVYRSLLERNEVSVGTLLPEELDKIYTCVLNVYL